MASIRFALGFALLVTYASPGWAQAPTKWVPITGDIPIFVPAKQSGPLGSCQNGCAMGQTCVEGQCMSCGGVGEPCCAGACLAGSTCLGGCCGQHSFYDDFSQGLDTSKWIVLDEPIGSDSYWRASNTTVSSGMLKLTAKVDATGYNGYSSGSVATQQWFGYGRYRITAQVSGQPGIVPAFWFAGANCSEIDVFEGGGLCGFDPKKMLFGHYPQVSILPGETECRPARQKDYEHTASLAYSLAFHVYELDWRPDRILISIDGVPMYSSTVNIPTPPMQLLLNQNVEAAGRGWPHNQIDPLTTQLPSTFFIDKVEGWTPAATCPVISSTGAWTPASEPERAGPICCPGDCCPGMPPESPECQASQGRVQSKGACSARPRTTR
ncbi:MULTISPECIES: family 16 glycosylhydrolase [unclassified Myxococcus]|uniref:glycoside hydrolase family 16 protein n=1 Tax=unclassified Myxococcus TaxID=2648731 RepID=UPI001CBD953F|nr:MULTISPECIES: glycoside hydrolase family 16 protein [unclassified Myxococcus]MBZ4401167.1 glycoside hydrolase family 16 protein [Myxococcus sp. AS-1-15]MBZ4410976.1 glycoside hydrolase family 16 protein [Myxococcus sp. XM-1-1-1]